MKAAPTQLSELVEQWTFDGYRPLGRRAGLYTSNQFAQDESFSEILLQLEYFADRFFNRYVPALYTPHSPGYLDRLWAWLNNGTLTTEQQRLLFEFAVHIAYLSFEDFVQLYRTAFVEPVTRWTIDQLGLSLDSSRFQIELERARRARTWYCPITDSMFISEFYHANGIAGIDQRPAFRSLMRFASPTLITHYMQQRGLDRLVLLEDFVCTGTQCAEVVEWAVNNVSCPVLFVPLVTCPAADTIFQQLSAASGGKLRIEPVLRLGGEVFVNPIIGHDVLFSEIHAFAQQIHPHVQGVPDTSYGPFGCGSTGATVVLFSNTPDNTLPLIHHHQRRPSTWHALFPRVSRETL